MTMHCESCGGPLLGTGASGALHKACVACLADLLLGKPEAPPGESAAVPEASLGGYRLVRELARGGMGTVWVAQRATDGAMVALKLLPHSFGTDPSRLARFRAEATLAARLVHPGIVAIRDIGEHAGIPFFTMDLVEGPDLGMVAGGLPMPAREAARVVRQVALAVHFAHEQGVLHRDIKPTNVLLGPDGEPRVTDFGLARLLDDDARLTATGETMGSPSFMAPELVAGQHKASGVRTDVHGLGGLLYFCLTGRAPFAAESVPAALAKAMESRPVPPREWEPSVPASLEWIALRCLARDPSARYASARAMAEDLERAMVGEPVPSYAGSPRKNPEGWARWGGPWLAVALATAAAGLAGGGAWLAWSGHNRVAMAAARANHEATALARYAMDMNRAAQASAEGDGSLAMELLEALVPGSGDPGVRGIEWFVLRRRVATLDGKVHAVQGPRPAERISWNDWPEGSSLRRLMFSMDGAWLVAGHGEDNATRSRAWRTGQPDATPAGFAGLPVAVGPGAREVLTTLPGGRLELRSLADGGLEGDATVPGEDLASGWELSADGAFVAAITMGGQLRLVHVASGQRLPGPTGRVTAFRLSPDGNGIVFATSPGTGWFTMRPRRQALVTEGEASAMMVDGSGARGAIGHADGSILVFGMGDGGVLARWKGHEGRVTSMAFAADERTLVSGGADGWLRFWNTTLWREVLRLRFPAGVDWVEPSPDGQRLAVVAGRQLHWLDTTGGTGSTPRSQGAASGFWKSPAASLKGLENRGESTPSARERR